MEWRLEAPADISWSLLARETAVNADVASVEGESVGLDTWAKLYPASVEVVRSGSIHILSKQAPCQYVADGVSRVLYREPRDTQ